MRNELHATRYRHMNVLHVVLCTQHPVSCTLSLPLVPFVRGEVLHEASSSPHLIVLIFHPSSVSCLLLPVVLLSCLHHISLNTVLPSQPWPRDLPRHLLPCSRNSAALFGSLPSAILSMCPAQSQYEWSFSDAYMAKHMHCIIQEGFSCSGIQNLNISSIVQKLCVNQLVFFWCGWLHFNTKQHICICTKPHIQVTEEMVCKHDSHDRRSYSYISPDKSYRAYSIASIMNCSLSSLTSAEYFLSEVLSLLGGWRLVVCSWTMDRSQASQTLTHLLYWSWPMFFTLIADPATDSKM